ncbi:MAG: trypsin-like peptidase domain-containing protein [Thiolinea sp.]
MKIISALLLGVLTIFSWLTPSQATELVESEIYQPAPLKTEAAKHQLKLSPLSAANRSLSTLLFPAQSMNLTAPTASELAALAQTDTQHKALKIGIERSVPALPDVKDWVWLPVTDGQAAQFIISSESASNLRALVELETSLPAGVELRVFSAKQADEVYGFYQQIHFKQIEGTTKFAWWTPTVSGSQLGLEIFVPEVVNPAEIKLSIPQISHIAYDLKAGKFKGVSESFLKFSSCDVSMACAPAAWQSTAQAVARYVFTDAAGKSYLCTGTLLADKDTGTQIPYFMTAAHCIVNAELADTMDFYWFYQESSCGSGNATWTRTTGGADLLATRSELDMSLVRMRTAPPVGSLLSGWSLQSLQTNSTMVGIHHGLGNPKQFSQGNFVSYASVSATPTGYMATQDPAGSFTQVSWTQGITAQGSSGSGVWTTINGNPYFKGTLVGGSSSCTAPNTPDEYTRLERFHPYVTTWLEATGGPLTSLVDSSKSLNGLMDGVIIARYLAGKRGTELLANVAVGSFDLSQLESKLDLLKPNLDIDGDNSMDANKDGILLIRYLMGLRDAALIGQFDFTNSKRKTAPEINQYLETILF